ncbi:MAG: CBS domain-containing protein [Candidatus Aenigmatarchaeota archaeon]
MLVKDVMNANVVVAKAEATIREASEVMNKYNIGSLVVMKDNIIAGIITEHNVLESVAAGRNPDETRIGEVMSPEVVTVALDSTIEQAVDLMVQHKIKKLPVVDGDKLKGIVTASDIIVVEPKLVASIANLISMKLPAYSGG